MTVPATREVAALDGQRQIAHMRRLDGHDIELDAQGLAEHADRRFEALGIVKLILHRRQMQDGPAGRA